LVLEHPDFRSGGSLVRVEDQRSYSSISHFIKSLAKFARLFLFTKLFQHLMVVDHNE
jgi:hypothetical protein